MNTERLNQVMRVIAQGVMFGIVFITAPAFAATGQGVYEARCASCHGLKGAGDGPQAGQNGATKPRPFSQSVAERMVVEKAMVLGVKNAPGHNQAQQMLPQELQQLMDYVNILAHP